MTILRIILLCCWSLLNEAYFEIAVARGDRTVEDEIFENKAVSADQARKNILGIDLLKI